MIIVYILIALLATIFGSMTGVGGGVIIKPLLDLLGDYDTITISVLSSTTLIGMSGINIVKHIRNKMRVDFKICIFLAIGSIIGGNIGAKILNSLHLGVNNEHLIKSIQNSLLAIFLIFSMIFILKKDRIKTYNLSKPRELILLGLILGMFASFLSIGGGPINVTFIVLVLSLDLQTAAIYSVVIMFFSQIANLTSLALMHDITKLELSIMPYLVLSGMIGGYVGALFTKKANHRTLVFVFNALLIIVVSICILNILL